MPGWYINCAISHFYLKKVLRLKTKHYTIRALQRKSVKAQIAQSVEQGIENPRVGGSIPPLGTTFRKTSLMAGFLLSGFCKTPAVPPLFHMLIFKRYLFRNCTLTDWFFIQKK